MSGLSGSKETAQSQVSVGMGLLAGSTVLLLTIIWGTCVIVGKCDIEGSIALDSQDTRGFSLTGMPFEIVHYLILKIESKLFVVVQTTECVYWSLLLSWL